MTTVKEIITDTEKLYDMCDVIDPQREGRELQKIVRELKATMRENNLTYLTAPQIGYNKRVFCVKFGDNDYRSIVNPVFGQVKGFNLVRESCNSFPDKEYLMPRNASVLVTYLTPIGKIESRDIKGKTAAVFQHCVNHLDGLLIDDIGLPIKDMSDPDIMDNWDNTTEEEKSEIIKMYLDSLDLRYTESQEQLEADTDLKRMNDAVKFINSVLDGTTTLDRGDATGSSVEDDDNKE